MMTPDQLEELRKGFEGVTLPLVEDLDQNDKVVAA
jgi:hypothetical protein